MPRRPPRFVPKAKATHKLTPAEAGEYGAIVQAHLEGDGTWSHRTVEAIIAEANRRLGIKGGKKSSEFKASTPHRHALMSSGMMDRRFDAYGRQAS